MKFADKNLVAAVTPDNEKTGQVVDTAGLAIAEANFNEYQRCRDNGHSEYLKSAEKCDRYYRGEQWDPQDLARLEKEGRPALTVNKILSTINTVAGEQRLRRADFNFKPAEDGLENSAQALTKLANATAEANQFDFLESLIFMDGVVEDRGFYDIRMDWTDNMHGEVKITREDNRAILLDADAQEYDPTTWRQVTKTRFLSLEQIAVEYGAEKADALKAHAINGDYYLYDSFEFVRQTFGNEGETGPVDWTAVDTRDVDQKEIKTVRVIDRQYYKYVKTFYLVDPDTGKMREIKQDVTPKQAKKMAKNLGVFLYSAKVKKVRWTVSADRVLLHDDWSPYRTFTIIPYFPIFRSGRALGLVRNLLSPQDQLNKLTSQELHIVNTTANSGYSVEKGSLANMTVDELASQGSRTGVVIEYNPGKKPPEKIQPNSIPTGIDRITQMSAHNIKEISGVNDSMLGLEGSEVSGVALDKKRAGGMTQMQVPMDNLAWTRWFVARKFLELFQDFYTDERVVNFTSIDGHLQRVAVNEVQEDGSVVNDITYGKYSIVIATAPARDTYNDSQFAEALNLRSVGINIPDHRVIEKSNLAQKDEIAAEVKQLMGLGEPTEEEIQINQLQQQIGLQTLVAELEKLQAEIAEMNARAMKLQAETQTELGRPNMELEKLEAQIQSKREEFDLRQRLALLSATNKLDSMELNNRGQVQRQLVQSLSQAQAANQKEPPNDNRNR